MKKKEPWKKSYPMVFLCPQCGSYTIMRESGGLGWYDSNGQMFSPMVNAKEIKNKFAYDVIMKKWEDYIVGFKELT